MTKLLVLILVALICHSVQPSFGNTNASISIYDSCHNQSWLCFDFPHNCIFKRNCQIVFRTQFDPTSSRINFELAAPSIVQDRYVAVGFANSTVMSGLVVQCYQSSNTSQSVAQYSFNEYIDRSNLRIVLQHKVIGFSELASSYQDGQLQCRWQIEQPAKVQYKDLVFDFGEGKFYVQLATGPFDLNKKKAMYHESNRVTSKSSVSLKYNSSKNPYRLAAETLERSVKLIEEHKKSLKQLQSDSRQGALVSAIESELIQVEALINELRTQLTDSSKPFDQHQALLLEEQLIRHELRLVEQITTAQLVVIDQKKKEEEEEAKVDISKPSELINKANELLKKGTDALASASSSEFSSIQSEIHEIEVLIKAIQAKPGAAELSEDELLLERHERALQILIDRINSKKD